MRGGGEVGAVRNVSHLPFSKGETNRFGFTLLIRRLKELLYLGLILAESSHFNTSWQLPIIHPTLTKTDSILYCVEKKIPSKYLRDICNTVLSKLNNLKINVLIRLKHVINLDFNMLLVVLNVA